VLIPEGQGAGEDGVDEGKDDAAVDHQAQHHRAKVPAQLLELLSDVLIYRGQSHISETISAGRMRYT
jgi:hypothetical protein